MHITVHGSFLEPVEDLDYAMQDKAKVGKKSQHTGVFEYLSILSRLLTQSCTH